MESYNTLQKGTLDLSAEKRRIPLWLAVMSYPIAYLYVCSFIFDFAALPSWDEYFGTTLRQWGQVAFVIAFLVWGEFVIRIKREQQPDCTASAPKEHLFWLVCTVLLILAPAFGRANAIDQWGRVLYTFALHGCAVYWLLCRSGCLTENQTGAFFVWDVFDGLVVAPFGGIHMRMVAVVEWFVDGVRDLRRRSAGIGIRNLLITLGFVLASLPVLGMVGGLLSEADSAGFAHFWRDLIDSLTFKGPALPEWFFESFVRFCFSLPVGAYLYGLVATCVRRERPLLDSVQVHQSAQKLRVAPCGALSVILVLFCVLYSVFFWFQAGHLFGAFFGVVPGTATASEYAREGFFQLCQVMFINFGLLAVIAKGGKIPIRSQKYLRLFSLILMVQSLLLAVTAASKLGLYIARFGFTPLRLLSAWAVLVLAVGSVLAIISILRPFRAVQKWVWISVASFVLLCLY